eukprot:363243-Chlamydomonas_euryale.AAC.12
MSLWSNARASQSREHSVARLDDTVDIGVTTKADAFVRSWISRARLNGAWPPGLDTDQSKRGPSKEIKFNYRIYLNMVKGNLYFQRCCPILLGWAGCVT